MSTINTSIRIRRDSTERWNSFNPILDHGELSYDTTVQNFKVGDGVNNWSELPYITPPVLDLRDEEDMILEVEPDELGKVSLILYGTYSVTINWGDGTSEVVENTDLPEHIYSTGDSKRYLVTIKGDMDIWWIPDPYFPDIRGWRYNSSDEIQRAALKNTRKIYSFGSKAKQDIESYTPPIFGGETFQLFPIRFESPYIEEIWFPRNLNITNVTTLESLFEGCTQLTTIESLRDWDVSHMTRMLRTFKDCSSLTDLDPIRNWDVSNVGYINDLFNGCKSLTSLEPLTNWDVSNIHNLIGVFKNCEGLQDINVLEPLKNWNISNIDSMIGVFQDCIQLSSIEPIRYWRDKTGNVIAIDNIFMNCSKLESLAPLFDWDTSSLETITYAFRGCRSLTSTHGLTIWDTSNLTSIHNLFKNCYLLFSLERLENWPLGSFDYYNGIFTNCYSLRILPDGLFTGLEQDIDFSNTNLSKDTLVKVFNDLGTPSSNKTINISKTPAVGLFSQAELDVAINKNWTIIS